MKPGDRVSLTEVMWRHKCEETYYRLPAGHMGTVLATEVRYKRDGREILVEFDPISEEYSPMLFLVGLAEIKKEENE